MNCYLETGKKSDCYGCGACAEVCKFAALSMQHDDEGFAYPLVNRDLCKNCGQCVKVCPKTSAEQLKNTSAQTAWGGYILDSDILSKSTSGGAFSAIVKAFAANKDSSKVKIFGVCATSASSVCHKDFSPTDNLDVVRTSKYVQTQAGEGVFYRVKQTLQADNFVLFSGTPCQIAALKKYLGDADTSKLLTVEVICEGVPSPIFIRKQIEFVEEKFGKKVVDVNYRYKDADKWDFEVMKFSFSDGSYHRKERWFNPFWSIWLQHLMSRPSCYECDFCTRHRVADITLGDLWGVHIYCPDLYNDNRGCSLIVCNTDKGQEYVEKAADFMHIRQLDIDTAIKYQSPLRKNISPNANRSAFMEDLKTLDYQALCDKWAIKSSLKLLISKYIFGTNRQKVFWWKLKQYFHLN